MAIEAKQQIRASDPAAPAPLFAAPRVAMERRADGSLLLRSLNDLPPYPRVVGQDLLRWVRLAPERLFLAQRQGDAWRKLSYGEALSSVRAIAQALLDRKHGLERPVMILAENGIDHALLTLAAMQVGIPVAPVSTAYSRLSRDYAKLKDILARLTPGLLYVDDPAAHQGALAALDLTGIEVVAGATDVAALAATAPSDAVERAFAATSPDTVAKILFTSGSTGAPKGVINTQRMLTSNQAMALACWPFMATRPPVLVDWLPWNHTFGGNHNFNMVLRNGGSFWIDAGKPAPGLIERSLTNLREISPTIYFNVPRGYAVLLDHLESDAALAQRFFAKLEFLFYSGAGLPQVLWDRLERLMLRWRGATIPLISSWGMTETAPMATTVHYPLQRAGNVGVPAPGCEIKLAPVGDKLEARVRGPNVTPGFWRDATRSRAAFDDEGFYRTGDAMRLADPANPSAGFIFDGRIGENFKLLSGTWVNVGALRVAAIAALAPLAEDMAVTGHERDTVGVMIFPSLVGCRRLLPHLAETDAASLAADPALRAAIAERLRRFNAGEGGSAGRIARAVVLSEPASQDANEITDKGYLNQHAILERRADWVARLYTEPCDPLVIQAE